MNEEREFFVDTDGNCPECPNGTMETHGRWWRCDTCHYRERIQPDGEDLIERAARHNLDACRMVLGAMGV